ncbi:MAG TPA: radical SAM protein [Candidatus Binataceae bacterium]|nr:radical SAM protein [Candidatus Binataceae bacterium]
MTKVTLVRPPALMPKGRVGSWDLTPPISVAYLAGSLRAAGHIPVIVDALGEAPFCHTPCFGGQVVAVGLPIDEIVARIPQDTAIIGISCMFSQDWPYMRQVAEAVRLRFPKALILTGGEHVTALPLFVLESCPAIDFCVLGEGEETIVEIADCVASGKSPGEIKGVALRRDGRPVKNPARARMREVDTIPLPAWDLTPINTYLDNGFGFGIGHLRTIPMLATRGCPYQCTFCSSPTMWTTRWMARDPGLVLDEIQTYIDRYGATNIDFYDLTAVVKRDWILTFCRLIEERAMKFSFQMPQGTRTEALDREVCEALYRVGCRHVSYAPESGSPALLDRIKKRVHLKKMAASMRVARKAGISLTFHIIFGFPDETRRDALKSLAFMARMALAGAHNVRIFIFIPYPGSALFNQLRESGKLPELNDEYFLSLLSMCDLRTAVSRCDDMSSRELGRLRLAGHLIFYSLQYAVRPWRLVRTLYNFALQREESHLDKELLSFRHRRAAARTADAIS